jgi:hypothetical protein
MFETMLRIKVEKYSIDLCCLCFESFCLLPSIFRRLFCFYFSIINISTVGLKLEQNRLRTLNQILKSSKKKKSYIVAGCLLSSTVIEFSRYISHASSVSDNDYTKGHKN